ncbi:MAG TPA: PEP-CTERM sorting domain-containing protein [Tichowtungia sp.]|nr:PEP-CTERM sorting domain-containing protein [Tichowtungia sp.]
MKIKLLLCAVFSGVQAFAVVWTGSLSYSNDVSSGLSALGNNASTGWRKYSILDWKVSDEESGAPQGYDWFYSYTLEAEKFAPVRWVIETGSGFSSDNIDLASVEVYDEGVLTTYDSTNNISFGSFADDDDLRKNMPAERYGMFWEATSPGGQSTKITQITFWSDVAPQWGDLYANCGGNGNRGWNSGFTNANPDVAASSGSVQNHVLAPIPEPATISLIGISGLLALIIRRIFG